MALEHLVTHPSPLIRRTVWLWSEGKGKIIAHSSIHSFYKYLLSIYNVPGTVLGSEDALAYKINETI